MVGVELAEVGEVTPTKAEFNAEVQDRSSDV
jgi:hypothetical protein